MGVPGFFAWLLRTHKNGQFICNNLNEDISSLYIDANCLFHPQCFKVLAELTNETNVEKLESAMIEKIEKYITYIIDFTCPLDLVYLAVDGVAPVAKISQQRKRRFRSIQDKDVYNSIKDKYKIPHNDVWSNIVITPGTCFMEKLHMKLMEYCKEKKKKSKYNIIYSSYHSPGEGEHKILQHIKNKNKTSSKTKIVYGLDADLFFLTIASKIQNIYLLREESHIQNNKDNGSDDDTLCFVSIDKTKEGFNKMMRKLLNEKIDKINNYQQTACIEDVDFCDDFVFICYLLGNDFLPHFPSIDIKKNGLDIVIDSYCDTFLYYNANLLHKNDKNICINNDVFCDFIRELSNREEDFFKIILPEYHMKKKRKKCFSKDKYEIELWNLENMMDVDINDPVKLGKGNLNEYKFRYYEHYFHSTYYQQNIIDNVCTNYLEGLKWVTEYYFNECNNWKWQYKYNHAPFISDIYLYMFNNNVNINVDININHAKNIDPLDCFTQLLCVIPPRCSNILPQNMRHLITSKNSPVIDMFPSYVTLDCINKDQYWQCIPNVPYLDVERIERCIAGIENGAENLRNKTFKEYLFKK